MSRVRFRRSGLVWFVHGAPPAKPGDRFEAGPRAPKDPNAGGCLLTSSSSGRVNAITCRRRDRDYEVPRSYKFDEELHELLGEDSRA